MKRTYKILLLLFTIVALATSVITTYAYLQARKDLSSISFTYGNIELSIEGSLISDEFIVPHMELIDIPFKLVNNSSITIDLQLVIKLQINDGINWTDLDESEYLGSELVLINDTFKQIGTNNYLLENIIPNTSIDLINSLVLDGYTVRNDYANKDFRISIEFLAKQSEHATWYNLGILPLF